MSLVDYVYYVFWGLVFFAVLYGIQQGMWILCALETQCYSQYMSSIQSQ
tara:strand:- start:452 stop:598 length:147 start_codon:yes stop_codon:yes gene_type:complete